MRKGGSTAVLCTEYDRSTGIGPSQCPGTSVAASIEYCSAGKYRVLPCLQSVPEQPHPSEHHRDPVLVGRCDDFLVAHGAAGLHDRADAGLGRLIDTVAEGEEGVGAE